MTLLVSSGVASVAGAPTSDASERVAAPGISGGMVLEMIGALLLVVLVIIVLAWLLRNLQRMGGQWREDLRMIGQIPLGTRERAVVVQVGEEQFLLGVGPGQVRFLCKLDQPLSGQAGDTSTGKSFARLLERVRGDSNRPAGGSEP